MVAGVDEHIYYDNGKAKTICTSHVLAAFGIDVSTYRYSARKSQILSILRRNGFAARSRMSQLRRGKTTGAARKAIRKMNDPPGTRYMLIVWCPGSKHATLLDAFGETLVDTDPRKKDKRKVVSIYAVFPKV